MAEEAHEEVEELVMDAQSYDNSIVYTSHCIPMIGCIIGMMTTTPNQDIIDRFSNKTHDFEGTVSKSPCNEKLFESLVNSIPIVLDELHQCVQQKLGTMIDTKRFAVQQEMLQYAAKSTFAQILMDGTRAQMLSINLEKKFSIYTNLASLYHYVANNIFATTTEVFQERYSELNEFLYAIVHMSSLKRCIARLDHRIRISIFNAFYFSPDRKTLHIVFVRGTIQLLRKRRDSEHARIYFDLAEVNIEIDAEEFFKKCVFHGLLDEIIVSPSSSSP